MATGGGKTEYYVVLGIILPRFSIVVTPMIARTWSLSWQPVVAQNSLQKSSEGVVFDLLWSCRGIQDHIIIIIIIIRCKHFLLFIGQKPTTWPANNCLQIMVCTCPMLSNCVWLHIIFCSCVNETTRDCSCVKKGRSLRFPKIFIKKQTWCSNDRTIIELGYRKISWFASVSHINYLPQPSALVNNWSACNWQITVFCSTSPNNS